MADEVVQVLTDLSGVYQEAAKKSRPIMYSARFFADLAQVAVARGKTDIVSDRGDQEGGTDGGQQVGRRDQLRGVQYIDDDCTPVGPGGRRFRIGTIELGRFDARFRRVVGVRLSSLVQPLY